MQMNGQQKIQQREKELQQLRDAVAFHARSAQTAVEDSERIFTQLIRYIERSHSEVIQQIRDQEKTAVSRAEELMERLEQEINDLRRRDAELEQLSHTQDHILFLQVEEQHHKIGETFNSFPLTLDLNTVNPVLCLFNGNRQISQGDLCCDCPDNPDRFDYWDQVLCTKAVCGRSYWEIERSESGAVEVAVSYENIRRKGDYMREDCLFGCNDHSWSLGFCSSSPQYTYTHNNLKTEIPVTPTSCRIGVYVDHRAGTLSFYSVSDTMTLIHTVQTTFTQPLYPGFRVFYGTTMKLCDLP